MSSDPNPRTTGPSTGPTTAPAAPSPHADPVTPHRLFRVLALAEAVTWTLLILGMIGKYALHLGDWPVSVGGGIHGFVFLSYCAVVVIVWIDARWSVTDGLLARLRATGASVAHASKVVRSIRATLEAMKAAAEEG